MLYRNRLGLALSAIVAAAAGLYILLTPPSLDCLDTKPFYHPTFVVTYLGSLGPELRESYFTHEIADIFFLIGYTGVFLFVFSAHLGRPITRLPIPMLLTCLSMGFFDLIETSNILLAILSFPDVPTWRSFLIATATPLKYLASLHLAFRYYRLARANDPARNLRDNI